MAAEQNQARPALNRTLGLRELVLYGIILVQPTAPMPLYGVVCQEAKGHVVTTVLIGMVAMLFTAVSYGRMARAYPSAIKGVKPYLYTSISRIVEQLWFDP